MGSHLVLTKWDRESRTFWDMDILSGMSSTNVPLPTSQTNLREALLYYFDYVDSKRQLDLRVEDLDIRCERLAVRLTCFGVAVQDFVYIPCCMY